MELTQAILQYDTCVENDGAFSVIVVAAGNSSRMGGVSKQLLSIGGIPVLARTLLTLERTKCIKNIVIVARECDILSFQLLVDKYMINKVTDIVCGGSCREESVKNGVLALPDDTKYLLVHDGARPFVTPDIIASVADAVIEHGAATCGVAVKDTLKVVKDGIIENTLDRSTVFSVQTPQGFNFAEFKYAITSAKDLSIFTDDCAVMESVGKKVYMVEGSYNNIKITTNEDIAIAEGIIGLGGEEL